MKRALLAAAAILAATPAHATFVSHYDFELVEDVIEQQTGTPVSWTRTGGSCRPKGNGSITLGYFQPGTNTITICQHASVSKTSLLNTLMHEGWHSVQDRCTRRPVFSDQQINRRLTAQDRRDIRKLYPVKQHRAEAEARAVANYYEDDPQGYVSLISHYCS